jgi:hypothetical protein
MTMNRIANNFLGDASTVLLTFPVASGVTLQPRDFVKFSSGRVTNDTIGGALLAGMVKLADGETLVGNAGGTVKALVEVTVPGVYLLDSTGTPPAANQVGQYFDLTGSGGAQLIDTGTASASSGQFMLLEANPQISPVETDTSWGLYALVEHALRP